MFNSGMLDVAIGLIFVYLLLSLVCSALNEIIEAKLKMRASDLERGIREILTDKDSQGNIIQSLTAEFYNHPLILSLFQERYDPEKLNDNTQRYAKGSNLPSYIPSRNFALALMDLVLPANSNPTNSTTDFTTVSGAASATTSAADTSAITSTETTHSIKNPLQPLRNAVSNMSNENVKMALLPLIDAAGTDVGKARENIENWYDSSMDRVSGWYKRRTQWIILCLGFLLAVMTNADTLAIANSLSYDVSLRNSLVAAAQEYAKANPATGDISLKENNTPQERVEKNILEIKKLGLPIGWNSNNPNTNPEFGPVWINKLFGWLVTSIAISLGAPFWFDLLNRIMIVRSTVKPREKSPEEPSIDSK